MALIPIGEFEAAGDVTTAQVLRQPGSHARTAAQEIVTPLVESALAADDAPAQAAAVAAGAAVDVALKDAEIVRLSDPAIPQDEGVGGSEIAYAFIDEDGRTPFSIGVDGVVTIPRLVSDVPPTPYDVVIVAGQSNATQADPVINDLVYADADVAHWVAGVPVMIPQSDGRLGAFTAREWQRTQAQSGRRTLLLNVALTGTGFKTTSIVPPPAGYWAGSGLGTWDRNLTSDPNNLALQLFDAIAAVKAWMSSGSRIVGVVWCQGEADAQVGKVAYGNLLDDFIAQVRVVAGDAALPFVVSGVVPQPEGLASHFGLVEAHAETPKRVTRSAYARAMIGGAVGNTAHFPTQFALHRGGHAVEALVRARYNQAGIKPVAVQNLRARRVGSTVHVSWDWPYTRVTNIVVEWDNGGVWTPATLDLATWTDATFDLAPGTTTTVRVHTVNDVGTTAGDPTTTPTVEV